MKRLLFVSPGRCGTVRLTQILQEKLPADKYAVVHQMKYSRLANVVGHILYYVDGWEQLKEALYPKITARYHHGRHFICTDPLTAMIIPRSILANQETYIIHLRRDHDAFARSMVALTRQRWQSRVAHNLIPFWQPGIMPLENTLRHGIHERYRRVSVTKDRYFARRYGHLRNYWRIDMKDLFGSDRLTTVIQAAFGEAIQISPEDLKRKANAT